MSTQARAPAKGSARFTREWAMPNADTTMVQPIGALVRRYLRGVSVDPFARNSALATHTNDLDPGTKAEHHMQAAAFLDMLAERGVLADVVIFDPPYSPRQIAECYAACGLTPSQADTQNARLYTDCKRSIRKLCTHGSRVLSFGWNTAGMGEGFELEELLIVCHGGAHNDTLCIVERMTQQQLAL